MEEYIQDQETVIQQLRLLLAAKEEELGKLRSQRGIGGDDEAGESVTDQLIKELEEKKEETSELRSRMKQIEAKAKEKLSAMAEALEEKEKTIASLQGSSPAGEQPPASAAAKDEAIAGLQAALDVEREEGMRRCAVLEAQLREAEALLAKRENADGDTVRQADEPARSEILRLEQELEEATADRTELKQLRDEIEALQSDGARSKAAYEERIAALQAQLESRLSATEAPLLGAAEGEGAPPVSALSERLRALELALEQEQLTARTFQVQMRGLRRTQQVLRGLCAGLSVTLMCILVMKVKQYHPAPADAALLAAPLQTSEASVTAGGLDEEMLPQPEVPKPAMKNQVAEDAGVMLLAAQPAVHTVAAPTRKTAVKSAYTVKKGDNLWLICQRELGDAGAVAMVVRDNRISNPGALKAGDVIYLPKK